MTKKKTKKKTRKKAKSDKDLVKKEYTDEEKARIAKHQDRKRRKPVKFKVVKSDSDNPTIALQAPDDPLLHVKWSEALGTTDTDLQVHLLDQVAQTFRGVGGYRPIVQIMKQPQQLLIRLWPYLMVYSHKMSSRECWLSR